MTKSQAFIIDGRIDHEIASDSFHNNDQPCVIIPIDTIREASDEYLVDTLRQCAILAEWLRAEELAEFIVEAGKPWGSLHTDLWYLRAKRNPCSVRAEQAIGILLELEKKRSITKKTHERNRVSSKYSDIFLALGRRDGFACKNCDEPAADMQIDHIIPIAKGGVSDLDNLQLLCPSCNAKKGVRSG